MSLQSNYKDHITFPKRTLAGSSMSHMADDNCKVVSALNKALLAAVETCPHPRDYIGKEDMYQVARQEHNAKVDSIHDLIAFYTAKAEHCMDEAK